MTKVFFERHARVSSSACERRFGGWLRALQEATKLLDPKTERGLVNRVSEYTAPKAIQQYSKGSTSINNSDKENREDQPFVSEQSSNLGILPIDSSNIYGDFVNFRGLQHAPVNEQGVVFLFGMICRELGYVVEIVRSGFPDCEAKRKVRDSPARWQRVRIEFEYESRSFRSHGHDPNLCDVIVCWVHNWPDCPIEVLELRNAMANLSARVD
jgi:hypothetical protein